MRKGRNRQSNVKDDIATLFHEGHEINLRLASSPLKGKDDLIKEDGINWPKRNSQKHTRKYLSLGTTCKCSVFFGFNLFLL